MKRHLFCLAAAALLCHQTPGLRAQTSAPPSAQNASKSARIGTITVSGNGTQKYQPEEIAAAGKIKPGDVVTAEQIQAAADRLSALGIFSTVNYRFTTKGDAIAIEFQVTQAPTYPLSFDNFPWFTDAEIANAIRAEAGLFTGESPDGGAMVDQISSTLENLLASRNIHGSVTHQLTSQAVGDGMMMQFRVDGPSLRIQSVKFGDPLVSESEKIKDRIPDIKGQPYSKLAVELFESEQVRPLYVSKGFLRAQIGPPEAHVANGSANSDASGVDVSIPIVPGPVYTWKGVSWQGNVQFPASNLDSALELKSGDVADGIKVESDWQSIEAGYGRRGFLDLKLNAVPQYDDVAHQVSYRVSIVEGPQYLMGGLIITGLSVEAEKRLRRFWQIAPGQTFNNGYYLAVEKELMKPSVNIFGELAVHYEEFGRWVRPDPEKHTVDVLFDFK